MVDLTSEMAQLWASLGAPPPGYGRVVQFVAANQGEGVSTVAREFARYAASRARRPVWLVDLDLTGSGQHDAIASDPGRYGPLGKPAAATPDGSAFFTVQPPSRAADGRAIPDARYLVGQPAGGGRLWVTRFRKEVLRQGQQPHLLPKGDYWMAVRRFADWVVVDAPSADRSNAALVTAPFMDFNVIVVSADNADTSGPAGVRDGIELAGGRCAGIVFNRAEIEPPSFLKRILP